MNRLFQKRRNFIEVREDLNARIKTTEYKLELLKKQRKQLEDENYKLINIHTAPILFYFGRTKTGSSPKEQYIGYFYNYASGTVIYRLDDFVSESDNVIDVREFFEGIPLNSNNIREIKNRLNAYVVYFMHRYTPESWNDLLNTIKSKLNEDTAKKILVQKSEY